MNYLERILPDIRRTIASGYYSQPRSERERKSLVEAIEECGAEHKTPLIAELKPRSPSEGQLIRGDAPKLGEEFLKAGAVGLSILTEPIHFGGSLLLLQRDWKAPALMKDFVIDEAQIGSGDAVLLIMGLLDICRADLHSLIETAHERELEVLLETHSLGEFRRAKRTEADMIGINNRDFGTMECDLNLTLEILEKEKSDRVVVSESGIATRNDVQKILAAGASAVLVGTSLLKAKNPAEKLKELMA